MSEGDIRVRLEGVDDTRAAFASATANLNKLKDATKQLGAESKTGGGVSRLTTVFNSLNSAMTAVGLPSLGLTAAIGGVVAITKNAINESAKYNEQVRDLSLVTGTGAEKTSRMLQVLDDFQLGAQDVTVATKALTKQGLVPTVETLAKLSDEYLKINDAQSQNEFILKNLGKGGLQWVNFLKQGSSNILAMNEGVNSNLILTEEQIAAYERYRLRIDQVNDSLQGAKVSSGNFIFDQVDQIGAGIEKADAIRKWMDNDPLRASYNQLGRGAQGDARIKELEMMYEQAAITGQAFNKMKAPLDSATLSYIQMAKAATQGGGLPEVETEIDYSAMITGGIQLTKVSQDYSNSLSGLNEKLAEQQALMDKYARYGETSKKYKEAKENADALTGAIRDLESATDAQGAAFALNLMQQDEAFDPQKAYDFAAATGQITKQAAEQYKAYTRIKDALGDNTLNADQAAYATRALTGDISALNGMTAKAWIDVYIRTHGTMIDFGLTGMTAEDWGNKRKVGGEVGFASGTTDIGRAGVFRVGEMGEEGLVVRRDGSVGVIPAGTWREMQKYGVGADGGYAMGTADAGGGGGMTPRGYAYLSSRRSILPAPRSVGGGGAATEKAVTRQEFYAIQKTMIDMAATLDKAIGKQSLTPSMDITQRSADRIGRSVAEHVNMRSG